MFCKWLSGELAHCCWAEECSSSPDIIFRSADSDSPFLISFSDGDEASRVVLRAKEIPRDV